MNEKLERVKATIVRYHRFYATLMMRMEWVEDPNLDAIAATDSKRIIINPVRAEELTDAQLIGVIVHELSHIYGKHHLRRGNRDFDQWNIACDYAINPSLISLGFELPPTRCIDWNYDGMNAEKIYDIIAREAEKDDSNSGKPDETGRDGQLGENKEEKGGRSKGKKEGATGKNTGTQRKAPVGGFDYVEDATTENGKPLSATEKAMQEMEMNIVLNQAARIAKQAGQFPSALEQIFDTLKKVDTDWVEELRELVQVRARNDYSWAHPNRRYIHQGLYLPSLHSMEMGKLGVIIDVSGSITMYADLLSKFMSQIKTLLEEMKTTATILCVNTTITKVYEEVTSEDIDHIHIEGGGGTNFIPGFVWFDAHEIPDVVIYFTDLYCSQYPVAPEYPVLWAVYGSKKDKTVPFGTVIDLK